MKITVERSTSWLRVVNTARWTSGMKPIDHEPSDKFKRDIMLAQHSPIRELVFDIKIYDIPYRNAVHFTRHHIGTEKYQCSLRDDRNKNIISSDELPQNYPVNLWMVCNAEALINISRKRLCGKASARTRKIWKEVVDKICEIDPIVANCLVPECVYRGFCPEPETCGFCSTLAYDDRRYEYTL